MSTILKDRKLLDEIRAFMQWLRPASFPIGQVTNPRRLIRRS
jgi:hypothetical protein